jgi:hypothetical protein
MRSPGARLEGQLGPYVAEIMFLATSERPEQDPASLWAGEGSAGGGSDERGPGHKGQPADVDSARRAALDQYERRAARVSQALLLELESTLPSRLDLFRDLWERRSDLGVSLTETQKRGAQLYLAVRLLSALAQSKLPGPLARLKRDLQHHVRRSRSDLRTPRAWPRALGDWQVPHAWKKPVRRSRS